MSALRLAACGGTEAPTSSSAPAPAATTASAPSPANDAAATRRFIIDTDTAADDASALILATTCPDVHIEGVTVLSGNVNFDQAARNALMALEIGGCDAPVYKGTHKAVDNTKRKSTSVFGTDGMGDKGLVKPTRNAENEDAIDFILRTVRAYPDEIEIVTLGPATNIAKAIERDPDTMSHVKMVWSMGTTGFGHDNASPVAEFNVYNDALAYKTLLDSNLPITIIGLDICSDHARLTDAQFAELERSGDAGRFVSMSFSKLREFFKENRRGYDADNCDSMAMMCALYPDFITETKRCHASCITDQGETYGQVILCQEGFTYDTANGDMSYNRTLVTDIDGDTFFSRLKTALESTGSDDTA